MHLEGSTTSKKRMTDEMAVQAERVMAKWAEQGSEGAIQAMGRYADKYQAGGAWSVD